MASFGPRRGSRIFKILDIARYACGFKNARASPGAKSYHFRMDTSKDLFFCNKMIKLSCEFKIRHLVDVVPPWFYNFNKSTGRKVASDHGSDH